MTRPVDMPPAERWEHGVRARYTSGCRCTACRRANADYQSGRAKAKVYGRTNALVPAEPARLHMAELFKHGVGQRTVNDVSGIAQSVLKEIKSGRQLQIREETLARILAVTPGAAGDGVHIPAGPTRAILAAIYEQGYTKRHLATLLGYKGTLQIGVGDQVTVKNAARIEKLWREEFEPLEPG